MKSTDITREELWAQQNLSATEIDYSIWERDRSMLHQMSKVSHTCTFVVDVYKCKYTFASSNFADLLGYDRHKIVTLEKQGDYLESRIHPDDRQQLADLQVRLGQFIYSFRIRDTRQQYIRVSSKQQVLEQSSSGKAWLILGNMDISPNQKESGQVDCSVINLKNGEIFSPSLLTRPHTDLTSREIEILYLIQQVFLSKEIAHRLCISIHTVNIHRQNLLRKLGVQNSIEAIKAGIESGLLS